MSIARLNDFNRIRAFTCQFRARFCSDQRVEAGGVDYGALRQKIQEDQIKLDELTFPQIRELSDRVSEGLRSQKIEMSLADKYTALVSDYIQQESPENRRLGLDDYFELLSYTYFSKSEKYISILASNINSALSEIYGEQDEIPEQVVDKVTRLLAKLNRLGIYNAQLFSFAGRCLKTMDNYVLSEFAILAQKYGLRTKHYLDLCYEECLLRLEAMDMNLTLNVLRSFSFFSFEYRELFLRAVPKVLANVQSLSNEDVVMMLNIAKTLSSLADMTTMRDAILARLNENIRVLPNAHLIRCAGELSRGVRNRTAKIFLSDVLEKVDEDDFRKQTINALVNLMHTINHYKMKLTHMTDILKVLGERMHEVVTNRNLGLWVDVFEIVMETGWFSLPFMQSAMKNIISEPQVLCRVSTYQHVRVLQTFYKLRLYHRESYETLLNSIEAGFSTLAPKFNMISEAILAAADANIERDTLFKRSLDFMKNRIDTLGLLSLDEDLLSVMASNYMWPRNIVTATWSFAVMEFHKGPEFATLMHLLVHPRFYEFDLDLNVILMALEAAEACIIDQVHLDLAHQVSEIYGDKMRFKELNAEDPVEHENMRDNKLSFNESQNVHFHKGRARATRHIHAILERLNKKDVLLKVSPHYNSPYTIDICFSKENRKGIVLFSGRELMRNHLDSTWSVLDTGSSRLKMKILKSQNWKIVKISCSEWAALESGLERKEFVKSLLDRLEISY